MSFFETIFTETNKRNLRFLVIGGLAINFYGYSRETGDMDLLIHRDNRDQWLKLFSSLGYGVYREGQGFLQLSPPEQSAWPVDFMLVRENTFQPMYSASREVNLYGVETRIPSLEHLLMLKLHALKNARLNRFLKDFLDVENLIRINKLDLKSENMKQLFAKYGTQELYEKISTSLGNDGSTQR
ncbi:MAG TPA: nucleotidyl transferase AbiEii/AbiGii toxin family protein [Verrucomicrobiae bacterium]|nr:nucleotidyl transferase AbiEii/AbiGii toxin family protein [Verrucomicrobiae bacterium]